MIKDDIKCKNVPINIISKNIKTFWNVLLYLLKQIQKTKSTGEIHILNFTVPISFKYFTGDNYTLYQSFSIWDSRKSKIIKKSIKEMNHELFI